MGNDFETFRKSLSVEQNQLIDRILGDAKTIGIPEGAIKQLLQDELASEVREHLREEKREDERRDERRDGERGEKPGNLPAQPPAGTKPVNPAEPKKQ